MSESSGAVAAAIATRSSSSSTSAVVAQQQGNTNTNTTNKNTNNNNNNSNVDDTDTVLENQLSADLALFLSNPSLRTGLADGSLDLKSYSETVNNELSILEQQCINVYKDHSTEIEYLNTNLIDCQTILSSLYEMLLGFQADLGGLSGEIKHLQERSRILDVQLKNRRAAESNLRHFLEHIIIAPVTINTILSTPVNTTTFVEAVQEIQQLYKYCTNTSNNNQEWSCGINVSDTVTGKEMIEQLETIRNVAVKRTREYLLQQMTLLRKPQTNIRLVQIHGLLKYSILYDFLEDANNKISNEIYYIYCECMSNTLQTLFRTYSYQLLQLDITRTSCTRLDVIAVEETSIALIKSTNNTNRNIKYKQDVFSLGTRASVLDINNNNTQQPIAAHVAALQKETYHYEKLYSSILQHLINSITNEHVFCRQFFKRDAFKQLFTNTLSILIEQIENYLFSCYDAICLLLMVSITHMYKQITHQRKLYNKLLDDFLDDIIRLIWPRLKTVMEGHLRSIQHADSKKLGTIDLHAHYVSRRFGEFCCSLLLILHNNKQQQQQQRTSNIATSTGSTRKLQQGAKSTTNIQTSNRNLQQQQNTTTTTTVPQSAGSKLLEDLTEMMDAFVLLLERLAEVHTTQKQKTVFLINNLDHMVCIFQERRVTGKECNKLIEQLLRYREVFVEEELLGSFSKMIAFVQQTEQHLKNNNNNNNNTIIADGVNVSVVESLVLEFASNWKNAVNQINKNVLSYFSNFRNGMEILKQCLTQLLLYYTRFQDIIRKVWNKQKPPSFCKDLVPTNIILTEIKKYALAI